MGEQVEGATGGKTWLAAVFCGPLAGTLIVLSLGLIGSLFSIATGGGASFPAALIWAGALGGALIGWPAMLCFGLPTHVFLYRRKSRKAGAYLLGGVLVGFVAALVLLGIDSMTTAAPGTSFSAIGPFAILCFLGSVLASWLFWLIRRPDKDVLRPDAVAAAFE